MPAAAAQGNRLEQIKAFRAFVAESAPYLTDEQERAFYLYTQRNLTTAQAGKAGIFNTLLGLLGPLPAIISSVAASEAMKLMKPSVGEEEASTKMRAEGEQAVIAYEPTRTSFEIGKFYKNPNGLIWECIGYRPDGKPIP